MIDIALSKRDLRRAEALLDGVKNGVPRVIVRSVNKVGVSARRRVVDGIRQTVAIKAKDLRHRYVTLRKANYRRMYATIHISGGRIPLIRWGARQLKRGVSYRINRSGGRKKISGAFIATMDSGHQGVYKRRGKARLPIDELHGPSIPQVFQNSAEFSRRVFEQETAKKLKAEVRTQLKLVLRRRRVV